VSLAIRRHTVRRSPRSDDGFSVIAVTATILVLLVLGLSLAAIVSENSGLSIHHVSSNRAFYAAQAGVEYAIVKLQATPTWGGLPSPGKAVGAASFWIAAPDGLDEFGAPLPAGQKRIVATGVSGEATRVMQVRVSTGGITTYAGLGSAAYTGDGGPATSAEFKNPEGVALGPDGALYIADTDNHVIRRVDPVTKVITTVAGSGSPGWTGDGTPATAARLQFPEDLAVAPNGDLYIADTGNHAIRKVTAATGVITTVAGTGSPGYSFGVATASKIKSPSGIALASNGDFYFADTGNHSVRKVSAGILTPFAGTGTQGYTGDGGAAAAAKLKQPQDVVIAVNGDIYIADTSNHVVRRVAAATGVITTVAGTGSSGYSGDGGAATAATFNAPESLAITAAGDVYVADTGNHVVRKFTAGGNVSTVVGTGAAGFSGDGGAPTAAQLNTPTGIAIDAAGIYYIADKANRRVRRVGGGLAIVGWAETRA
jgi:sugar lactone lactonase YvrE